jgi:hypothetical protein
MESFLSCFDFRVLSAVRESSFFSRTVEAESEREGIRSRNKIESVRVDSILSAAKRRAGAVSGAKRRDEEREQRERERRSWRVKSRSKR